LKRWNDRVFIIASQPVRLATSSSVASLSRQRRRFKASVTSSRAITSKNLIRDCTNRADRDTAPEQVYHKAGMPILAACA
jgi:hypothetical protein